MDCAFDSVAFDAIAFDVCIERAGGSAFGFIRRFEIPEDMDEDVFMLLLTEILLND